MTKRTRLIHRLAAADLRLHAVKRHRLAAPRDGVRVDVPRHILQRGLHDDLLARARDAVPEPDRDRRDRAAEVRPDEDRSEGN